MTTLPSINKKNIDVSVNGELEGGILLKQLCIFGKGYFIIIYIIFLVFSVI